MTEKAAIRGVAYALPADEVTNEDLAARHPAWKMDDIAKRTGVLARRRAARGETALDLGERASRALLERLSVRPGEVDGLMVCTQTPDHPMPPNACLLQDRLGLDKSVAAFDFTLACSGYVYGLFLAKSLVESRALRSVLLVTGDTYSSLISPDDRGTMTLFGDGAAATLVTLREGPGIGAFDLGTDGANAACFRVPAGGARMPRTSETAEPRRDVFGNVRSLEQIEMVGAAVLEFVKREVPACVSRVLAREGVTMEEVDLVVCHQASKMSSDFLARALAVPASKMFVAIERVGNTVSASIPIALRDAEVAGVLQPGHRVLLVGFGVGLSWGATVLRW